MTTLFEGGPVMGGTFPALIWASVISAWEDIQAEHAAEKAAAKRGREEAGGDEYVAGEADDRIRAPEDESYEAAPEEDGAPEAKPKRRAEAPAEGAPKPRAEGGGGAGGGGGVTAG